VERGGALAMKRTEPLERLAGFAQRHDRADLFDDVELLLDQFDGAADRWCHTPTTLPLRRLLLHILRLPPPVQRAGERDDEGDDADQRQRNDADKRTREDPAAPY